MQGVCERKSSACPSRARRPEGPEIEAKDEEVKVESLLQLDKTTVGMEVKVESQLQVEETTDKLEVEEHLDDIFCALRDAQSELKRVEKKWHAKDFSLQFEVNSLRAKLHDGRRELEDTRFVLQDCATKVASLEIERAAAVVASENERRKLTFLREGAHQKMKALVQGFDAIVTTLLVRQRNLESEVEVHKMVANAEWFLKDSELENQQRELDALRRLRQEEKHSHEVDLASAVMEYRGAEEQVQILKHELDCILLELDDQKAKIEEVCNAKLRIRKLLTDSQRKRRRLERDLIVAGEEVTDEKMTMEEAHRTEMEKARHDCRNIEAKLLEAESKEAKLEEELLSTRHRSMELEIIRKSELESLNAKLIEAESKEACLEAKLIEAESKEAKLADQLFHSRDRCKELEVTLKEVQHNLAEEEENSLCQICLESPKDSLVFPCLHSNYCFSCLESHRKNSHSCPTCRTTVGAILKCVVG